LFTVKGFLNKIICNEYTGTSSQGWQYITVRTEFENYTYFGIKSYRTSVTYLN